MRVPVILILAVALVMAAALAGCSGTATTSTYSVDDKGVLSLTCVPATTSAEILFSNGTYTKSKITLHTQSGDVVTYLAAPAKPKAAIVYVPGTGETIAAHEERMGKYAAAGYAFLFVDTRGRGGETPGIPFGQQLIQEDFTKFQSGEWPQYYLTICDLVNARQFLAETYAIPVYTVGSSNGGRYSAIAAGVDQGFAGYVGISTSDWGVLDTVHEQGYTGDPVRFAASLEPSTYFKKISPRPVWIFHNATDPVIPFGNGKAFFEQANEPKTFTGFIGDHGINADVDDRIIMQWAQIYATRA
jgi:hypothetical protein